MGVPAPQSDTMQEQGKEPKLLPQHFHVLGTHNSQAVPCWTLLEEPRCLSGEPALLTALHKSPGIPALRSSESKEVDLNFRLPLLLTTESFFLPDKGAGLSATPFIPLALVRFVLKSLSVSFSSATCCCVNIIQGLPKQRNVCLETLHKE